MIDINNGLLKDEAIVLPCTFLMSEIQKKLFSTVRRKKKPEQD